MSLLPVYAKTSNCFAAAFLILAFGCFTPASAQTGQITGRVTDSAAAIVPDAQVKVTETSTGTERVTPTNEDGYYTVPSLPPGPYQVAVERAGFRTFVCKGLQLQVNQDLRLDIALEVGSITQEVVVTGQAPLLETESH